MFADGIYIQCFCCVQEAQRWGPMPASIELLEISVVLTE